MTAANHLSVATAVTGDKPPLDFENISTIPLSALRGDNITQRSAHTPWYSGPTLMAYLETIAVPLQGADKLVFPIQWVNWLDATFRGFCGSVAQGRVQVRDEIRVTTSGQTARVAEIVTMGSSIVWKRATGSAARQTGTFH